MGMNKYMGMNTNFNISSEPKVIPNFPPIPKKTDITFKNVIVEEKIEEEIYIDLSDFDDTFEE